MELYLRTQDHSVSQEAFELHLDRDLDMLVTQPRPKDLDPYYDSQGYISHTDGKNSLIERLYQVIKRINLRNKLQHIDSQNNKVGSLLDIGAGTGDFVQLARSKGYEAHGMEPNVRARQMAAQKGVDLATDWEALPDRKYDAITLWHVLEHVPDLKEKISALRSLLERDGRLVVAVPNFKSYDAQHYGSFWAGYDVPRHLWHFSKKSIGEIFAGVGMEIIAIHPLRFDAFYVSLLSEKYKGGKGYLIKGFWFGLLSNLKALGSGEHSSLIYVLKRKD